MTLPGVGLFLTSNTVYLGKLRDWATYDDYLFSSDGAYDHATIPSMPGPRLGAPGPVGRWLSGLAALLLSRSPFGPRRAAVRSVPFAKDRRFSPCPREKPAGVVSALRGPNQNKNGWNRTLIGWHCHSGIAADWTARLSYQCIQSTSMT